MKPELAASFIAAVIFHALLLFGFRMETPARPLAMSDEPSPVDVSLVEAAPEPAAAPSAAPAPMQPAPTPEPPEPTPAPTRRAATHAGYVHPASGSHARTGRDARA